MDTHESSSMKSGYRERGITRLSAILLALGTVVILLAALISVALLVYIPRHWQAQPLNVSSPLTIDVPRGYNLRQLGKELRAQGLLPVSELAWRILTRGMDVQAGEYEITPAMPLAVLLAKLDRGEVVQRSVTLLEGWTFRDVRAALANAPRLRQEIRSRSDASVMEALSRAGVSPEGRFFPDTYLYLAHSSDTELLERAAARMDQVLHALWADRDPGLPLQNPEEALVLASIVEKETGDARDRAPIAGVFVRRLERRMRLQSDPTVIFGLGEEFDGDLRRVHLRSDHPWNTYTRYGLPPTPIALPGRAALQATLNPAAGDALYFVARGDGTSEFSNDLAAHNRAVRRFQLNPIVNSDSAPERVKQR